MNNDQWHGPAQNPFAVVLKVAQAHHCTSRLYATLTDITRWELYEEKDFIDDLLQEIAGATGIVAQLCNEGWYACMDTPKLKPADPPPLRSPEVRYYALLATGDLSYVGQFESISKAFDHNPGRSVWMVDDNDVSQWINTVESARNGTLPPTQLS